MQKDIEIKYTCPLGSQCEEIKNNQLHRCMWYIQLAGKDPQSNQQIDEWRCAIAWQPILSVEMAQTNRGQTHALESFRNESVKGQQQFNSLFSQAVSRPKLVKS